MPGIYGEVPHYVSKTEVPQVERFFAGETGVLAQAFGVLTPESRRFLDQALNLRGWDFEQIENILTSGGKELQADIRPIIQNFQDHPHIRREDVEILIQRLTQ